MKVFKQILTILCVCYFLIAGSGYNLVRYCCNGCANEGIEAVANKSCETIHHEHEHESNSCCNNQRTSTYQREDVSCSDVSHQTAGCHIWRLQTDVPAIVPVMVVTSFGFDVAINFPQTILSILYKQALLSAQPAFSPFDNVLPHSGRDILTYHAVLII